MQVIAETFDTSYASNLQEHFKMHNGEKSNKCDQCNYAYFYACDLQKHLKTHNGEKSKKCDQSDYPSFYASNLQKRLKMHSKKFKTNATIVTMHLFMHTI